MYKTKTKRFLVQGSTNNSEGLDAFRFFFLKKVPEFTTLAITIGEQKTPKKLEQKVGTEKKKLAVRYPHGMADRRCPSRSIWSIASRKRNANSGRGDGLRGYAVLERERTANEIFVVVLLFSQVA